MLMQLLIVKFVGVGANTDAYLAAQAVPTVVGAILIGALQSVWLPRFSLLTKEDNKLRLELGTANGQSALLGGALLVFLGTTVSIWLPILFPGFTPKQHHEAIFYSIFLLCTFAVATQSSILLIALRAQERYFIGEAVALAATLVALCMVYVLVPRWGLAAAAWITLGRVVTIYVIQLHLAEWPPIFVKDGLRDRNSWKLMRPLLLGASIYKTSPVVDRYWGSLADAGAITLLSLAQLFITAFATVLERSAVVPLAPRMSRLIDAGRYREARYLYIRFTLSILLITVAVVSAAYFGADAIVLVISRAFSLNADDSVRLLTLIAALGGFLFASVAGAAIVHVFYSMGDTHTPVYIGVIGFSVGLLLKWAFFHSYGVLGLAAATSTYFVMNILLFLVTLELKISRLEIKR
ncbi:lipid II flippase MurJ [Rhizobium sp. CECT 9324]|nr:lipid II flippase MurJ [Rhizobium sp. CECT 9324]